MTDKEQILEAIRTQRWFFFKNNENFLPQGQESLRALPNADVKQLPPAD